MFAPRSATNARAIDSVGLKTRLINAYIPHNLVFYQRVSPSYTRLGSSQRSIVPSQVSRRLDGWRGWAHLTPVSPITHPHQLRLTSPRAVSRPPRRLTSPRATAPFPRRSPPHCPLHAPASHESRRRDPRPSCSDLACSCPSAPRSKT